MNKRSNSKEHHEIYNYNQKAKLSVLREDCCRHVTLKFIFLFTRTCRVVLFTKFSCQQILYLVNILKLDSLYQDTVYQDIKVPLVSFSLRM